MARSEDKLTPEDAGRLIWSSRLDYYARMPALLDARLDYLPVSLSPPPPWWRQRHTSAARFQSTTTALNSSLAGRARLCGNTVWKL